MQHAGVGAGGLSPSRRWRRAQNAQQNSADAGQTGEKGLQCLQTANKPDGTPHADWDKLKAQTAGIFNNAAGHGCVFRPRITPRLSKYLRAAVEADPTNLTEVYYLALADLAAGTVGK